MLAVRPLATTTFPDAYLTRQASMVFHDGLKQFEAFEGHKPDHEGPRKVHRTRLILVLCNDLGPLRRLLKHIKERLTAESSLICFRESSRL